ncbi:MAG: OmpH family outer membrane protein [Ekhidna sp.]|nr:OmpH family outer membrane protein [Ekhidna sp.]
MKVRMLLTTALAVLGFGVMAQLKVGYTNVDYILSLMPEAKQIESELASYDKQLSTQLEAKYADYQAKVSEYQQNAESYTDVVRADKENEIVNLQTSIQQFEQNAQNSLLQKRSQLLQPAYEKIGTAIEQISKENGYSHVFNMTAGGQSILLYAREEDNVTNIILKKLGIDPPADN